MNEHAKLFFEIEQAEKVLGSECDGPLTPFVVLSRATNYAARTNFSDAALAEATHNLFCDFGWLTPDALLADDPDGPYYNTAD